MCVSHVKDVDGCVCAGLIKLATQARFLLTDYGRINECLRTIKEPIDVVYLCDLSINETNLEELDRIRGFAEVTYVDHHPIDESLVEQLKGMGVEIVHDLRDCASVLAFNLLHESLPHDAGLLASYAAVSDRLEDGPIARELLQRYDRDLVYLESMLLSFALDRADIRLRRRIVKHLSTLDYPHQIDDVLRLALEQAERIAVLRKELPSRATRYGSIAYVEAQGDALGSIANLLLDVCDAAVGIGYNTDQKRGVVDLSIRGHEQVDVDLGALTAQLAKGFGGFGGGHPKACGARIPASRLTEFIHALAQHVTQDPKL
jgi:oligoribonuclease NrnB/cAMP/cGMP phosphodiesterase (DHH superfamily)